MSGKKISDFWHSQGSNVWASCAVSLDVSNVCQFCEIGTLLNHIYLIDSHITHNGHTVCLIVSRQQNSNYS